MVRRFRPIALAGLWGWPLLAGCLGDDGPPTTLVSVDPDDVATTTELRAEVEARGEGGLDIELVEWPSGAPVPATVLDVASDEDHALSYRRLEVRPIGALPDGWYAVRVRAAAGSRIVQGGDLLEVERWHELVSRIGVGLRPLVAELAADNGSRVAVWFSERVTIPDGSIEVRQDGAPCTPIDDNPGSTRLYVLECDAPWPGEAELVIGPGITTRDGRPVAPLRITGRLRKGGSIVPPGGPPSP